MLYRAFATFLCAGLLVAYIPPQSLHAETVESARQYFEQAIQFDRSGQVDKALEQYSEAIRLDPRYVDAYLDRAAIYLRQGKNNLAFKDYAQAVHAAPSDYKSYFEVGEAYWHLGDKVSALSLFRKCMTMNVRLTVDAVAMGDHFASEGLYDEALSNYTAAIDHSNPHGAKSISWLEAALLKRAAVEQKKGNNAAALEDLNRAIASDPRAVEALTARGKLYFQMKADNASAGDLDKALQLDPKAAGARLARSQLRAEAHQYKGAMDDLNFTIQSSPKMAEAFDLRGLLWAYGFSNYDKAVEDLSAALAIAPDSSQFHFDLGSIRMLRKEYLKAVSAFTSALNLSAPAPPILEERAKAYAALGNFTAALQDAGSALRRDPEVGSLHVTLGTIYLMAHEPDEAISDLSAIEQEGLDTVDLHATLGSAYAAAGNLSKALKELKRAARLGPRSANANDLLCRALRQADEASSALAACNAALAADPKSSEALIDRGLTNLYLENYDQALSDLNRARESKSRYAEVELARSVAYAGLGKWREADDAYRSALYIDPKVRAPELSFNPSTSVGKSYADFIHGFDRAIRRHANDPYSYLVRGDAFANLGNPSLAFAEFSKATHVGEPTFEPYLNRCIILTGQGSYGAAEQNCRRALELAPNEASVYAQLLEVLEARRDYSSGAKEAGIALQSTRRSPALYVHAGNFLYFLYDASGAERNYLTAISIDPFFAQAEIGVGTCRLIKKQYEEAIERFSHAIEINDRNADYYLHRANAYAANGDYANAATNYKIALAVNHDPSVKEQIAKLRQNAVARLQSSLKLPINLPTGAQ